VKSSTTTKKKSSLLGGFTNCVPGPHSTGMEPEGLPEGPGNRPEVKVTVAKGQRLTDFKRPAPAPCPPTEKELEEQRKQREQKQQQLQLQQQEEADNAAVLASQIASARGPLRQLALRQAHYCSLQASLLLLIYCSNARSSEGSQGQGSQQRPEGLFESPSRKVDHPKTRITKISTITPGGASPCNFWTSTINCIFYFIIEILRLRAIDWYISEFNRRRSGGGGGGG